MKKILFLSTFFLLPLMAMAESAVYTGKVGDCYYYVWKSSHIGSAYGISEDKTDTVKGDITIPGTIEYEGETYHITAVGRYGFDQCKDITSVTICEGVETLSYAALYRCRNLTSISLPSSLKSIEEVAFASTGITSLIIPEGVTEIKSGIAKDCYLTELSLPSTLTTLPDYSLSYIFSLEEITVPASIDSIGQNVFSNCSSLKTIYIKGNVTKINPHAFYNIGYSGVDKIYVPKGTLANYANIVEEYDKIEEITYPTHVWDNGVLPGKFSVSADKQVNFSQGNLQYVSTWQFATNQWDIIGNAQADNNRDLFGWGTGDAPNKVSTDNNDYATFTDWGTNAITNGGNEANLWRTLTKDEWVYLFCTRTNAATLFGLGSVNGVNGTILLPDNWTLPAGASFTASTTQGLADKGTYYYNSNGNNFEHNTYTAEQWAAMEANGAVFLPAAGSRYGTGVDLVGSNGNYWSATPNGTDGAYYLLFLSYYLLPQYDDYRYYGRSVRLVKEAESTCTDKTSEFSASAETSYEWNGTIYTESGDYEQIFPMANGCDSIVTLHLTITSSPTGEQMWRADDEDIKDLGTITANTTVRGLTFVATADKTIIVDANNKTYGDFSFTHRIKLGGTVGSDYRHLRFDVNGDCTIEIYAISASSSATRTLNIGSGAYDNVVQTFNVTGDVVNYGKYDYSGPATTMYIGSANNGINILAINLIDRSVPTELENSEATEDKATKVLRNSQVLILRGDKTYTVTGQEVK